MEHLAEKTHELTYKEVSIKREDELNDEVFKGTDVIFISLPSDKNEQIYKYIDFIKRVSELVNLNAKVVVYGENSLLPMLCYGIVENKLFNYQTWISVRKNIEYCPGSLPIETKGVIIFSKDKKPLHICKVRLPYTYCPACNKTTKDYGGKKHLFHEYGTLMSDVWKDFRIEENDHLPKLLIKRIKDMFSINENKNMVAISLWDYLDWKKHTTVKISFPSLTEREAFNGNKKLEITHSTLINGDCLEELKRIEDNTIDYIFVDPPYNLKKKYQGYNDNLEIEEYFKWCDKWLNECYRVLKPGRHLSILNLPLWCVRHYAFLSQKMIFSSWVTWEALSRPVRNIMPANYVILTFRKEGSKTFNINQNLSDDLRAEADYYCLRQACKKKREPQFKPLSDLWTDIHRLKHNSRRYDHPCQLPPLLMKRLISIYTNKGDTVLDCFNGVGSTTLTADVLERRYVGIELVEKYHEITKQRHLDVSLGLDPFRKNDISADKKTKNNEEKRNQTPRNYKGLSKRKVQLAVKDLSIKLNKIPTMEEALENLDIPRDFYEKYFKNWSEVVSAAKTTGMSEVKKHDEERKEVSN